MQVPFELFNNTDNTITATIKANGKVECLTSNLKSKKAYISSLNFSDESIPKFIPNYINGDVNSFKNEIINYILSKPGGGITNDSTVFNIPNNNMTPYYVMATYTEGEYTQCTPLFIPHMPTDINNIPSNYPGTIQNYYENEYYYYYDFGIFLQQFETALNESMMEIANIAQIYDLIDNNVNLFNLTYNDNAITYNFNTEFVNYPGIKIYFSNNLCQLLSMPNIKGQMYSQIDLRSSALNEDYNSLQIPVNITRISSVKNLIITSNMPCETVQIFSNINTPNFIESYPIILFLNFTPSSLFTSSNSASYVANDPIPYIYFDKNEYSQINDFVSFTLRIRLNNGIMLNVTSRPNDYINLVLRVEKNLLN